MIIDKGYLKEALLRWNYFPKQKKRSEEIPPIFTTRQLTPDLADKLVKLDLRKKDGYDQIEYSVTRYNNVARQFTIPHPLPYVHLVDVITRNWDKLSSIADNNTSLIKPEIHADGRIIVMDYEDQVDKVGRVISHGFGKNFKVHTDIANCFPSVYTHAIPWALVGLRDAKDNKNNKCIWYNEIDFYQRCTKRQETQGLSIGPATSNIFAEVILSRIDEELSKKYSYIRYIDDYTCYVDTFENAQEFIRDLSGQLGTYRLALNIKKTDIFKLPTPIESDWILDISTRIPAEVNDADSPYGKSFSAIEALKFLDYAVSLISKTPDGSVLKYAVKCVIPKLGEGAVRPVLDYLLSLARYYPLLLPVIGGLLRHKSIEVSSYQAHFNCILRESAINRRSDGMSWAIYYMISYRLMIDPSVIDEVLKTRDCIAFTALYLAGGFDSHAIQFTSDLEKSDCYEKDRYWLLRYQLYRDDKLSINGDDEECFKILKNAGVSFTPKLDDHTESEQALVAADFTTYKNGAS